MQPFEMERTRYAEDLALASACAAGNDAAWERFVREYRPVLYRAADALDSTGGARELADALYGDLYGLKQHGGERQSLFRYYHGRSSLATWLRAVLAQRYVDRIRADRRLDPLPDEAEVISPEKPVEPDRTDYADVFEHALGETLSSLNFRDRLRLGCYYAQELTLFQTGQVLRESEATVSRQLARTRRAIRKDVERRLRTEGLDDVQITHCFSAVADDVGSLDLSAMLEGAARKKTEPDRSV
ncbi:MAG TPA: sigma-70 family RNA polymerase sigma factor [Vicinamibacterales bacterium]|nr:sigma-70 family RNA polymerase sigma factor [Vicinamibacterales bacterium]